MILTQHFKNFINPSKYSPLRDTLLFKSSKRGGKDQESTLGGRKVGVSWPI